MVVYAVHMLHASVYTCEACVKCLRVFMHVSMRIWPLVGPFMAGYGFIDLRPMDTLGVTLAGSIQKLDDTWGIIQADRSGRTYWYAMACCTSPVQSVSFLLACRRFCRRMFGAMCYVSSEPCPQMHEVQTLLN